MAAPSTSTSKHDKTIVGEWKCSKCEKCFNTKKYWKVHAKICGLGRYQNACRVCRAVFADRWALNAHFKKAHPERTVNECKICGYLGVAPKDVKRHETCHSDSRKFKCKICGRTYKSDMGLNTHMKVHEEKYKCEICGSFRKSNHDLRRHIKSHERNSVKCLDCERIFQDKAKFDEHIANEHPGYQPFECNTCGMRFSNYANRYNHLLKVHSGEKRFKCELCGKGFHFAQQLRTHLKMHEKFKTDEQFNCFYCENSFTDFFTLRRHVENFHENFTQIIITTQNKNVKHYICPKCDYYGSVQQLLAHSSKHAEDVLQCQYCSFEFFTILEKRSHERKHVDSNGKPNFNCAYCPDKFEDPSKYAEHFQEHYRKRVPHSCKYCPRKFKSPTECVQHILRTHKDKIETIDNDELTMLERVTIEIYGFEKELDPACERNEDNELAFRCNTCSKKFFGCKSLKTHHVHHIQCKADSNVEEFHSQDVSDKETNYSIMDEMPDKDEFEEDSDEPDDHYENYDDVPEDLSAQHEVFSQELESTVEVSYLPLAAAVYRHISQDENLNAIIWCKKFESDVVSLMLLNPHRMFISVFGSSSLEKIKQNSTMKQELKVTSITVHDENDSYLLTIVHSRDVEVNTESNSIEDLEHTLKSASQCKRVEHFIRESQYETSLLAKSCKLRLKVSNHIEKG